MHLASTLQPLVLYIAPVLVPAGAFWHFTRFDEGNCSRRLVLMTAH
jgi:hypothetical protein